jgi:hypothetical protein
MPYIRVKSPITGHEFDVTAEHATTRPDWHVVDATPVAVARPPKHGKPFKVNPLPPKVEPVTVQTVPRFSQSSAPAGN